MEKSIVDFHKCLYMPLIQKIELHSPHIHIIGNIHCGNTRQEEFKHCASYQYVLCRLDDA